MVANAQPRCLGVMVCDRPFTRISNGLSARVFLSAPQSIRKQCAVTEDLFETYGANSHNFD